MLPFDQAITDISPPDKLFKNLGIEGAIISLGFVIGPGVAGLLLTVFDVVDPENQARAIVWMAILLSAVNVGLKSAAARNQTNTCGTGFPRRAKG